MGPRHQGHEQAPKAAVSVCEASQRKKRLPFVVFLDIDATLIGKAECLVAHYFLWRAYREALTSRQSVSTDKKDRVSSHLQAELPVAGPDLVRPHVGQGLRQMAQVIRALDGHDSLELFVASLGQKQTVQDCKVPGIECVTGLRFNRPLFSTSQDDADNCRSAVVESRKTVRQCFDRAMESLSRKARWKHLDLADRELIFATRFLMIDDTPDVSMDAASNERLLTCPVYTKRPWYDVAAYARHWSLGDADVEAALREYLVKHPVPPQNNEGKAESTESSSSRDDDFFLRLPHAFAAAVTGLRGARLAQFMEIATTPGTPKSAKSASDCPVLLSKARLRAMRAMLAAS